MWTPLNTNHPSKHCCKPNTPHDSRVPPQQDSVPEQWLEEWDKELQCFGARNVRTAPEVNALTGRSQVWSPYWASMRQTHSGASHECSIGLGSGSLEAMLTPWTLCHVPQSTSNWEHCRQGGHLVWNGVRVVGASRVASAWIPVNNISKDWSMYMCGYIQYIYIQQHSGCPDVLDDVIYCRHIKR